MKPYQTKTSISIFIGALLIWGCTDKAAVERREFQALEAAVGTVANASPEDRAIRLEQLEAVPVSAERIVELKRTCVASYRAFDQASQLLGKARTATKEAETAVRLANQKKEEAGSLSPDEELRIVEMGKKAADALKAVSGELEAAERLVAACGEARKNLRFELAAP